MCCRIEILPLIPEIAEAQLAIGQFTYDPSMSRWTRTIEEEATTVIAVISRDRLCLSLMPTITQYSHHFGKRLAVGVYLEMAARYGEKVGGMVEQLSNVSGCAESGIVRKQLAWYPTQPLDYAHVCAGFQALINGEHHHDEGADEPIAYG